MGRYEDRASFEGILKRLSAEGESRWRMDIRVIPNEEDVTEVRFVNLRHERRTVIYGGDASVPTQGRL